MSTLRVSNIEAKADASSPTIDEKVKVTSSQGRVLVQIDGKTAGITSIGINTTGTSFTIDRNQNVQFAGIITAVNLNTTGVTTFSSGIVVAAGTTAAPSISPSGDSNTGIFFPSADTVAIGEGGVEVLRVNSNGNLLIGTTNSLAKITSYAGGIDNTDGGADALTLFKNEFTAGNQTSHMLRIRSGTSTQGQIALGLFTNSGGQTFGMIDQVQGTGIQFRIAGTERVQIDSSGRMTLPYQPYARASCSSLVSATNAIPLNAYNLSRGGITISGNRFTVPVAGAYVIGYHHLGNSGSGACQIEIRVNNSAISGTRTQDTNSSNDSFGSQTVRELAANDYVEFFVIAGTTHGNPDYNSMWIWLLG